MKIAKEISSQIWNYQAYFYFSFKVKSLFKLLRLRLSTCLLFFYISCGLEISFSSFIFFSTFAFFSYAFAHIHTQKKRANMLDSFGVSVTCLCKASGFIEGPKQHLIDKRLRMSNRNKNFEMRWRKAEQNDALVLPDFEEVRFKDSFERILRNYKTTKLLKIQPSWHVSCWKKFKASA